jgi:energy-coupling factor transport system permease protein
MECRCYRGGEGRTRMTKLKLTAGDFVAVILFAFFETRIFLIPGIFS